MAVPLQRQISTSPPKSAAPTAAPPDVGPYQVFIVVLCVIVLAGLAAELLFPLSSETRAILHDLDIVICGFFFIDFVLTLRDAPDRKRYMLTWGWIDLLSSIPASALLWGRVARLARLLKLLRGIRAVKELYFVIRAARRAEGAFWALVLLAMITVTASSIAILHVERDSGGNIETAADALWWAFVTVTTVGYGDTYPVSPAGRLMAVALMTVGIGLFGTFTAFVATWFIAPGEEEQNQELIQIRSELQELRLLLTLRRFDTGDAILDVPLAGGSEQARSSASAELRPTSGDGATVRSGARAGDVPD